jgi:flavin reductase (DIM6/NTAB) family NADH-FMN oxidoreductase RutF
MARYFWAKTPEHLLSEPVSIQDFVQAMGQHVASVCVITTQHGAERYGLTATAVSSVCADPPRLLVCVNKSGQTHHKIIASGHFGVNVLGEAQEKNRAGLRWHVGS